MTRKRFYLLIVLFILVTPIITLALDCPPPPPPPTPTCTVTPPPPTETPPPPTPTCTPPPPPPPPPPAACSPGFWKQPQHFQYWVGYAPSDPYGTTGMTLLEALQGGKATRVSRFVVAGWLNAANPYAPCYDD